MPSGIQGSNMLDLDRFGGLVSSCTVDRSCYTNTNTSNVDPKSHQTNISINCYFYSSQLPAAAGTTTPPGNTTTCTRLSVRVYIVKSNHQVQMPRTFQNVQQTVLSVGVSLSLSLARSHLLQIGIHALVLVFLSLLFLTCNSFSCFHGTWRCYHARSIRINNRMTLTAKAPSKGH